MLTALVLTMAASGSIPQSDPCDDLHARDRVIERKGQHNGARPVTPWDLATLTDIGRADPVPSTPPFGLSPDGKTIAVILRRADPVTNSYCKRLITLPVDGSTPPKELDHGGDYILSTYAYRGLAALPAGQETVAAPRWSPDGKTIAYLRKDSGPTQIWLVAATGVGAHPVTRSLDAIEDFTWLPDGSGFITATRPALRLAKARFAEEAKTGYEYDGRFDPLWNNEPQVPMPVTMVYSKIKLSSGQVREASAEEASWLTPSRGEGWQTSWRQLSVSPAGHRAVVAATAPQAPASLSRMDITWADGSKASCTAKECSRIYGLWWSGDGNTLDFQTRIGWKDTQTAFYRWRAGTAKPEMILSTPDVVTGCAHTGDTLVCARDGAVSPRRVITIDLPTGKVTTVFNPNAGFDRLALGKVQRLTFVNAFGIECYADLILPPNHRPGQKHPMILVQYTSDGFLRGGTGDEEPIQALAARGFAVLSFANPGMMPAELTAHSEREMRDIETTDFAFRRSTQSAIELAVAKAVETGTIDAARMGISGMSEGDSATQWALIHSSLFKVASLGVCCEEQTSTALAGGPGYAAYLREMGYPPFDATDQTFWPELSLSRNIDRIDAPLLVQSGGNEYQAALYTAQAFRDRSKAFDFYVFPEETHVKWQPSHRLAMYERNIDWFAFWFFHERDCSPTKIQQYERWLAMKGAPAERDLACSAGPSSDP